MDDTKSMSEKYCPRCKTYKPLEEFAKNKSKKDGMQVNCRKCVKAINADYYKRTPEKNPARLASRMASRERNQEYLFNYLSTHPCVDCGESDVLVLEFDHVRGVKKDAVTQIAIKGLSIEALQNEIDKCEVRCANDHRRVTWARQVSHWKQKYL